MVGVSTMSGLAEYFANGLSGLFAALHINLGTAAIIPTRSTILADLGLPTFTGYATVVVTTGTPSYDVTTGRFYVTANVVAQWNGPSDNTGQTINSWGLSNPVGPTLLATGNLDTPTDLLKTTDQLSLVATIWSDGTVEMEQVV